MVEPKHVALEGISEDNMERLMFYVYIELEQGILALEVVQNALRVIPYLKISFNAHSFFYFNTNYFSCHREVKSFTLAV